MKRKFWEDAMNEISDKHISEAAEPRKRQKRRTFWLPALAAVLAIAVCIGVFTGRGGVTANAFAIDEAVYPQMAKRPDQTDYFRTEAAAERGSAAYDKANDAWREARAAQADQPDYGKELENYLQKAIPEFLTGETGENRVFSPANVYMALSMLAEVTAGDSQKQILDLLEAPDLDTCRVRAKALWNKNYCDDGSITSILANSLWLSDEIQYKEDALGTLARDYYASSFRGTMGSEEYNESLRDWINEQTGGRLKDQTKSLTMNPNTVLALVSTLQFKGEWDETFSKEVTAPDTFHAPSGDRELDFMRKTMTKDFCWGEQFSAVELPFDTGCSMAFLLPDEGVSPEELLKDPEAIQYLISSEEWANVKYMTVHLSLPKFDVTSQTDLTEGLKNLGVRDVFDTAVSDFSPLADLEDPVYLSKADHAARVSIDEDGAEGTAFTVLMAAAGAAAPPDEDVDFTLDRPFVFVIRGLDGLPLFVGIVNEP